MKRFISMFVALGSAFTVIALGGSAIPAHAATAKPSICSVAAHGDRASGITVEVSEGCGTTMPVVSLSIYLAHNISGNPISEQKLVSGEHLKLEPFPGHTTTYFGEEPNVECFEQIDVAYGDTIVDLSTPYGSKLIYAVHSGTRDCTETESPTPTPTVTSPAPTTTAVTPTPTKTTVTPTPSKTTTSPKPTPTTASPTPTQTNPGHATGCVGDSCDTPTPKPSVTTTPAADELPFTGFNWKPLTLAGVLLLFAGAGAVWASKASR